MSQAGDASSGTRCLGSATRERFDGAGLGGAKKTRASLRSPIQRRLQQGHKFSELQKVSQLLLDEVVVTEYTTADRRDDLMSSARLGIGTRCDVDGETTKLELIQNLPWWGLQSVSSRRRAWRTTASAPATEVMARTANVLPTGFLPDAIALARLETFV